MFGIRNFNYFLLTLIITLLLSAKMALSANLFARESYSPCNYEVIDSEIRFCAEKSRWRRTFTEDNALANFYVIASDGRQYDAFVSTEPLGKNRGYNIESAYEALMRLLRNSYSLVGGELSSISKEIRSEFGGSYLITYRIEITDISQIRTETIILRDSDLLRITSSRDGGERHRVDYDIHMHFRNSLKINIGGQR